MKVSGVCQSSHQKQVAVKAAGGGGLLEEVAGMPEVWGLQSPESQTFRCRRRSCRHEEVAAVAKIGGKSGANTIREYEKAPPKQQ